jgi:hypothetical protein
MDLLNITFAALDSNAIARTVGGGAILVSIPATDRELVIIDIDKIYHDIRVVLGSLSSFLSSTG